jgi:hypothetical protein
MLAVPDGPFSFRMRTNGPREAHALDETIASMEGTLTLLRSHNPLAAVRGIIQAYRADEIDDLFDEDLPF